jgi:hypothetical protein
VIHDQNVERAKAIDCGANQRLGGDCSGEIGLNRVTDFGPTLGDKFFGPRRGMLVIEGNLSPSASEQTHSSGPDAARATGDEGHSSFER